MSQPALGSIHPSLCKWSVQTLLTLLVNGCPCCVMPDLRHEQAVGCVTVSHTLSDSLTVSDTDSDTDSGRFWYWVHSSGIQSILHFCNAFPRYEFLGMPLAIT